MDLIVEDGSIVEGANTYLSLEDLRDFAAARGVSLPDNDDSLSVLAVKSMDWLESLWDRYAGQRTDPAQALQWPRSGVRLYGEELADDSIPLPVKRAQGQVVIDLFAGIDPQQNYTAEPGVIREKVDVLEVTYADRRPDDVPYLRKAMDFLSPVFGATSGPWLNVVRV